MEGLSCHFSHLTKSRSESGVKIVADLVCTLASLSERTEDGMSEGGFGEQVIGLSCEIVENSAQDRLH